MDIPNTIPAEPMPCGHLDRWWNMMGEERCFVCHGEPYPYTGNLIAEAARVRKLKAEKVGREKVTI